MNVEALFFWIRLVARAVLHATDAMTVPRPAGAPARSAAAGAQMKPERIQFWLQLVARFVLAVIAGANGETGKSGERYSVPASTSKEVDG